MPSRTTRKSTRPEPQIDPWLPTCNRRACQFQKPIGVVATRLKMQLRWNYAGPNPRPDTRPASFMVTGAGFRRENPRLRRREKNVLDIPSPRTWLTTPVESTKRSRQVFGTSDPAECAVNCSYRSGDCTHFRTAMLASSRHVINLTSLEPESGEIDCWM